MASKHATFGSLSHKLGKSATVGASSALLAYAAQTAELIADVTWPSTIPSMDERTGSTTFFGVSSAVGSLVADVIHDFFPDIGMGSAIAGPVISTAGALAYVYLMVPGIWSEANPVIGVAPFLVGMMLGEYTGDMVYAQFIEPSFGSVS